MMEMRRAKVARRTLGVVGGHYEVLGVDPSASMRDIRSAYIDLARRNHPDRHAADPAARRRAEERMREINAAWAALGSVESRSAYDRERLARREPHRRPRAHGAGIPDPGEWTPHDDRPAEGFDEGDDRPITSGGVPGWLALAPPLLVLGGIVGFFVGGLAGLLPVVGLAIASVVVGAILFLVAPLVAMATSRREDARP